MAGVTRAASFTRLARSAPANLWGAASNDGEFHVVGQRGLLGMNPKDHFAALHVRAANHHAAIETAGAEQCGIEHVRPVGGRDEDHAFVGFEAVHFNQQLIQGLLALIVSTAKAGATMASDGIDFIDEDDAGSVLLASLKQVTHAAGADAHEHLDEIRSGDGKERNIRFTRDGPRQQGLTSTGRSDQQDAFGNTAA